MPRYERVPVWLYDAIRGKVPRPERLVVDYALRRRLEEAAKRETDRSYCPCRYLGMQTETGYEPDPAKWPDVDGPKSHQHIWVEFPHVRNATTNKPHRARVRADDLAYNSRFVPGSPLNTSASRSLRFSIQFMDEFAENKEKSMKFRGMFPRVIPGHFSGSVSPAPEARCSEAYATTTRSDRRSCGSFPTKPTYRTSSSGGIGRMVRAFARPCSSCATRRAT